MQSHATGLWQQTLETLWGFMDAMSSTYLNANLAHFYDMVRFSSTQATNTQEVNQSSCFINLLCMFNISTITIKIGLLVLPKDLLHWVIWYKCKLLAGRNNSSGTYGIVWFIFRCAEQLRSKKFASANQKVWKTCCLIQFNLRAVTEVSGDRQHIGSEFKAYFSTVARTLFKLLSQLIHACMLYKQPR